MPIPVVADTSCWCFSIRMKANENDSEWPLRTCTNATMMSQPDMSLQHWLACLEIWPTCQVHRAIRSIGWGKKNHCIVRRWSHVCRKWRRYWRSNMEQRIRILRSLPPKQRFQILLKECCVEVFLQRAVNMPSAFSLVLLLIGFCWLFRGHNASSILERNRFLFGSGIHDTSDIPLRSLLKSKLWQEVQQQYPGRMVTSLVMDNWFVVAVCGSEFSCKCCLDFDSEFCHADVWKHQFMRINQPTNLLPFLSISRYTEKTTHSNWQQLTATAQRRGASLFCHAMSRCRVSGVLVRLRCATRFVSTKNCPQLIPKQRLGSRLGRLGIVRSPQQVELT